MHERAARRQDRNDHIQQSRGALNWLGRLRDFDFESFTEALHAELGLGGDWGSGEEYDEEDEEEDHDYDSVDEMFSDDEFDQAIMEMMSEQVENERHRSRMLYELVSSYLHLCLSDQIFRATSSSN
jgi:hypothetical protein